VGSGVERDGRPSRCRAHIAKDRDAKRKNGAKPARLHVRRMAGANHDGKRAAYKKSIDAFQITQAA